jgi:5-methyltetrahydrofolate--homocysteine methyltransferase
MMLLDCICNREVLICDGAMGTQLIARGLAAGECPEMWCLERPSDVREIAAGYVEAGSNLIETNSFGGNALKLKSYGFEGRVGELNHAAAAIARAAIGDKGYVAGSVGPTGIFAEGEGGKMKPAGFYEVFREQIVALAGGGADAICIETMWSALEAAQAIRAAKENTSLPVICTFTFNKGPRGFRTAVGLTPEKASEAALEAGADIIGANCGNGIDQMIEIARQIREAFPAAPLMIQANAGLPKVIDGHTVYQESPTYIASRVNQLAEAGANIIGGCCGTTPEHIRAIAAALRGESPAASRDPER